MCKVFIAREAYKTYYQYRKAITEYRDMGYIIRNATGGVWCFATDNDYTVWKCQK